MSDYSPCPSCRRHIKDSQCPFCGAWMVQRAPITLGRVSRAMVFASATLAAAACGSSQKKVNNNDDGQKALDEYNERENYQNHPCSDPDPAEVAEAQKQVDEAKTAEEKQAAEAHLAKVNQSVCAPYGAPPARR